MVDASNDVVEGLNETKPLIEPMVMPDMEVIFRGITLINIRLYTRFRLHCNVWPTPVIN